MLQQGLKYGNLLDFLTRKAQIGELDSNSKHFHESELRDALRSLEEDNLISIFGNSRAPTIRFNANENEK